jgi:hypothetical protein
VPRQLRSKDVFINCPFDSTYKPIFEAIVFAVYDLGFVARCALEFDDSSANRFDKIADLVEQSRYGIHDISSVGLDASTSLPRFNMPLELGLFLGCKRFGLPHQRKKACLILDKERYRYQKFMSDIAGQDIHKHDGNPEQAIIQVRDWLCAASKLKKLPGGAAIVERYRQFRADLPALCADLQRQEGSLIFSDWAEMISLWLQASR